MKHRLLLLSAVLLSACRIEPGAMLGDELDRNTDCAVRQLVSTGWASSGGVFREFPTEELKDLMSVRYQREGYLWFDFLPRREGFGVPKLASLTYQRLNEDGNYELISRKAVCKERYYTASGSSYTCVLERRNNAMDGRTFYFADMDLSIDQTQYHYSAVGLPTPCEMKHKQIQEVMLAGIELPTAIPDEMVQAEEER